MGLDKLYGYYEKYFMMKDFKFTVVGGGTAGWLTALFIKKHLPQSDITVIESSEIGILGAGEGTVPSFIAFLRSIDISPNDIIYHANGTFKNGIKFTNWNGGGSDDYYFHGFGAPRQIHHGSLNVQNGSCEFD